MMRSLPQKIWQRTLSAGIMIPLVFGLLWLGGFWWLALVIVGGLIALSEGWRLCSKLGKPHHYSVFLLLAVYVFLAGYGFFSLRQADFGLVFRLLCLVVVSDIAAYFGGKLIGGAKLCPSLSPNKTYAGLLTACFVTWAMGFVVFDVLWLGLWVAPVSQIGDIAISSLKRRADVKDSGHWIPGHGGILDRIDGHLAVMLVALLLYGGF